jgi:hypothetical protein
MPSRTAQPIAVTEALDGINPDDMTPKQAQQVLYTLKELAKQDLHS